MNVSGGMRRVGQLFYWVTTGVTGLMTLQGYTWYTQGRFGREEADALLIPLSIGVVVGFLSLREQTDRSLVRACMVAFITAWSTALVINKPVSNANELIGWYAIILTLACLAHTAVCYIMDGFRTPK